MHHAREEARARGPRARTGPMAGARARGRGLGPGPGPDRVRAGQGPGLGGSRTGANSTFLSRQVVRLIFGVDVVPGPTSTFVYFCLLLTTRKKGFHFSGPLIPSASTFEAIVRAHHYFRGHLSRSPLLSRPAPLHQFALLGASTTISPGAGVRVYLKGQQWRPRPQNTRCSLWPQSSLGTC